MSVIVGQPQRMMIYWQWFIGQAGICLFCVCLFGYGSAIANLFLGDGRWKNGFTDKQGFIDGQGVVGWVNFREVVI